MSIPLTAALALALAAGAFVAALMGIGGGVLYTPLQVLFGIGIHQAAATSLFLIIILSFAATHVYRRARKVDWRMAVVLELFTIAGGFLGGYGAHLVPSTPLVVLLAVVLVFSGAMMLLPGMRRTRAGTEEKAWFCWQRAFGDERYTINCLVAFPLCFLAGIISGAVGVGGGVVKVPLLVLLLGVPIDIAIATSAFMVGITAVGGFAGHLVAGSWDWRLSMILAPGVFLGAQLGAHTMLRIDRGRLRKIFGLLVIGIAIVLVAKRFA